MSEKYAERIAALIEKAEATEFPKEAELLMAKAEELMLKHSIDEATIAAKRDKKKPVAEDIIIGKVTLTNKDYITQLLALGHKVAWGFPIKSVQVRHGNFAQIWYVGHKTDVEYAMQLFRSLDRQAIQAKNTWWKTEGKLGYYRGDGYIECKTFVNGFSDTVGVRLYDMKKRVVAEAGHSTDLVLRDRKKVVEDWVGENMELGSARKTRSSRGSYAAESAGRQAGRTASLNKELS